MGMGRDEREKMVYFITTDPMTEKEFFNNFTQPCSKYIKDWTRDLDDYNLYKDDPKFKELNREVKEAKKSRDAYKEIKRQLNK